MGLLHQGVKERLQGVIGLWQKETRSESWLRGPQWKEEQGGGQKQNLGGCSWGKTILRY